MSKKAKDAEVTILAEAMLQKLASLREQGGEAYPSTLRQLADSTGSSTTDEQVQKAAAKKVFTGTAVVLEKVGGKPSFDAPVYFKGDTPAKKKSAPKRAEPARPKDDGAELAGRMLLVLEAQRQLGAEAYPLTLRRLAELCDRNASDPLVTKAAAHKTMTDRAVVAAKVKGKPQLDAPVVLRDDIEGNLTAVLPALLAFALSPVPTTAKGKTSVTTAFTPSEVKGRFVTELQKPVLEAIERGIEQQDMPARVVWILTKGKPYLLLVDNLRPGTARPTHPAVSRIPAPTQGDIGALAISILPAHDFAAAFREAFAQLDRRNGSTNFVTLADLRKALAGVGREEFDTGLRALRLGGEFSLDSHEGLHGSLTSEEREAGVHEAGSLLVYVSRR